MHNFHNLHKKLGWKGFKPSPLESGFIGLTEGYRFGGRCMCEEGRQSHIRSDLLLVVGVNAAGPRVMGFGAAWDACKVF